MIQYHRYHFFSSINLILKVLPVLGNESIHFNINYSELEGLIGVATIKKDGLLSKNMSEYKFNFGDGACCISFNDQYSLGSFIIRTYYNGRFGLAIVNPSTYKDLNSFKAISLGSLYVDIYSKTESNSVFLKPLSNTNGRISIQFITPAEGDISISPIPDFTESEYNKITPQSLG